MNLPLLRVGSGEPELWVVAGVHGDEVEGIACVEEALAKICPLRGTLIGVPVANPPALYAGARFGPDGLDLNRAYPGRPDGQPTERLAHELCSPLLRGASALLTLHSWSRQGVTTSYVEYARGDAVGRALARALGIRFVEAWDWPDGLLPKVCVAAGIPAVEVEIGGLGRHTREGLQIGIGAIRSAAEWLGLLDGGDTRGCVEVTRHWLEATTAARVHQLLGVGQAVRAGDVVCELRRLDGSACAHVTTPASGWMATHLTYGWANRGERIAVVFQSASNKTPTTG